MFNLFQAVNFFGIALDWDENKTMGYLMLATFVLFVVTLIVIGLLIWYTRSKKDDEAETVAPKETVVAREMAVAMMGGETVVTNIIEHPIITVIYEDPTEEEVSEETLVEEVAEEPFFVEVVEEPIIEEVAEEPVVEEIIEAPIVETVVEEPPVEEKTVEEPTESSENSDIFELGEFDTIVESGKGMIVYAADGTATYYSYKKSYAARLIQAKDEIKEYYNQLKNFVLSYKKVKTKISWRQENAHYGKDIVCWFTLRGKSLYLYLPLNPDDYVESKYKVEKADGKRYEALPCMYKVNNKLRVKYALELLETVLNNLGAEREEREEENFAKDYYFRDTRTLIRMGLIKIVKTSGQNAGNQELLERVQKGQL